MFLFSPPRSFEATSRSVLIPPVSPQRVAISARSFVPAEDMLADALPEQSRFLGSKCHFQGEGTRCLPKKLGSRNDRIQARDGNALESEWPPRLVRAFRSSARLSAMGALTIFGHVEGEVRASSLVGSLAAACSDPPQTVHVAFMSLKPLFSYG